MKKKNTWILDKKNKAPFKTVSHIWVIARAVIVVVFYYIYITNPSISLIPQGEITKMVSGQDQLT